MDRHLIVRHFMTACLTYGIFTTIRSQTLYDADFKQYGVLNRGSKEVSTQSLLDEIESLLKKKTADLQKLVNKEDAYNDLMTMYSHGHIPNGRKF